MGNAAEMDTDSTKQWHKGTPRTPGQDPMDLVLLPIPSVGSPAVTWALRGSRARRAGRGAGMGAGAGAPWEEAGHVTPAARPGC